MVGQSTERKGIPGGLRAQLLVGLCLLIAVAFSLVAVISLQVLRRHLNQAALDEAEGHARLLARRVSAGASPAQAARIHLDEADRLAWAGFVGPDGLTGSTDPSDEMREALGRIIDSGMASAHTIDIDQAAHVVALAPVPEGARTAVAVQSLAPINHKIDRTRDLLLVYLGLDALFILLVGYAFLTFVVVRPIRALGVASERAARGDFARPVKVLPANEFGQVGRQFNQMLVELAKKREQLVERLDELDQANQKLRQTQDSLVRSEKLASVGQLAAGVAHEVGNPLAALSGYLELLEDGDLDVDTTDDIIVRGQGEVERMRTIIRDLLDYSRDDVEATAQPVALAECVEEATNLVKAQPKARDVVIDTDLADDLPKVQAVASQVVQVLVNLLINAVDALDGDGNIAISAAHDADTEQVTLRISDDGPGVPPEKVQRIFDPFFTTKDPGEGTGLGLAICLRIMRRFGGDIRVENSEGGGACFEVVFSVS